MDQPPRTDRASSPAGGQAATVSESKVEPKIDRFYVGLALKRAQHESRLAVNAELASLGTNISQVNVLREIEANPGVSSVQLVETLRTIETRAAEARAHRKRLVIVDP
jgi:hypothetical protein